MIKIKMDKDMKKTFALAGMLLNGVFLALILFFLLTSGDGCGTPGKKQEDTPDKAGVKSSSAVLRIKSKPSGAKIFVSGYYKGKTPGDVVLSTVSNKAKEYSVKIVKPGYIPYEKKVKLISGDRKSFRAILKSK